MRNLFLALVLANLAFAAWDAWFAPAPPATETAAPQGGTAIKLVSEIEAEFEAEAEVEAEFEAEAQVEGEGEAERPPAADTPGRRVADPGSEPAPLARPAPIEAAAPVPPDSEPPLNDAPGRTNAGSGAAILRCVSVGPFREPSEAASASAKLETAGYEPVQRVGEGDIWVGYWVYIERIATRDEANAMLRALRDSGIGDAYVIPGEEDGDIISLGVFNDINRAGRLRDQVRQIGYEPVVVDRTRRGTVYWLDVLLGPAQRLDFEALQTPGRITRLEQRDCLPA